MNYQDKSNKNKMLFLFFLCKCRYPMLRQTNTYTNSTAPPPHSHRCKEADHYKADTNHWPETQSTSWPETQSTLAMTPRARAQRAGTLFITELYLDQSISRPQRIQILLLQLISYKRYLECTLAMTSLKLNPLETNINKWTTPIFYQLKMHF